MHSKLNTPEEGVDVIDKYREEIAGYLKEMNSWGADTVPEAMMGLAAMNARASEIRHEMHGASNRKAQMFRQNEVNDFLETCEFQFKVYSRLETIRQNDFQLAKGF